MFLFSLFFMLIILILIKFNKIHPFIMGIFLLMYSLNMSIMMSMFFNSYWYSYILFLIMIGGILILFIYFISMASNEYMKIDMKLMMYFYMLFFMIITFLYFMFLKFEKFNFLLYNNFFDINSLEKMNFLFKNFNQLSLIKLYNYPSNKMTFLIIIYLFFTLISIVKICFLNYAPMRQWNK